MILMVVYSSSIICVYDHFICLAWYFVSNCLNVTFISIVMCCLLTMEIILFTCAAFERIVMPQNDDNVIVGKHR